jgi:hypothetical protein
VVIQRRLSQSFFLLRVDRGRVDRGLWGRLGHWVTSLSKGQILRAGNIV